MKEYRTPLVSLVGPASDAIQGDIGVSDGGGTGNGFSTVPSNLEEE